MAGPNPAAGLSVSTDNSQVAKQVTTPGLEEGKQLTQPVPALYLRLLYAAEISALQSASKPPRWYRSWYEWMWPDCKGADIVKHYEVRPNLQVRIFFPSSYDQTSPQPLPTLFTIHGGGFAIGSPTDDNVWNRTFADSHNHLVIALDYAKAPWNPFPGPTADCAALLLAVLKDESLPLDRSRITIGGFSAGGNLALSVSQHPEIRALREHGRRLGLGKGIRAVVPMYAPLDFTAPRADKAHTRRYKPALGGLRGRTSDYLAPLAGAFDWAYIPYGQDKADARLSPGATAERDDLPAHICVVGCELDMLGHDAWRFACRFACRLAGRDVPTFEEKVGQEHPMAEKGALAPEEGDEKFGWEVRFDGDDEEEDNEGEGGGSVKWILVPDAVHGYDFHVPAAFVGDMEGWTDGTVKARKVMERVARWLEEVVYT